MISDEAVEAAAKAIARAKIERESKLLQQFFPASDFKSDARSALEAAAPYMLSHERQQTADAHRDAIVNRDTADRLERELETAKADAWDEGAKAEYERDYSLGDENTNPYRSQT